MSGGARAGRLEHRIGARIFLLALAVRLVHAALTVDTPIRELLLIDSATYDRFARLILAGQLGGENVYAMNVLYPYFLALVYAVTDASAGAVLYLQTFLSALNVALVATIGAWLLGRRAGIAAGILAALYAPNIFYAGALLTPTLVDTFGLTAVLLLLRHRFEGGLRPLALAGLALGLQTLTRANAILLLPLAFLPLARWNGLARGARAWLVLAIAPVLLVGLATARNARVAGEIVPVSANVAAFYVGHNDAATGLYVMPSFTRSARFEDEVWGTREALSRQVGRDLTLAGGAHHLLAEGLAWARAHPREELELLGRKLRFFFNRTEPPTNLSYHFARDFSPVLRYLPIDFGVIAALGLFGLVVTWQRRTDLLLLHLYGLVPLLTCLVFFVAGEYRAPAAPVFLVLSGGALVWLVDRFSKIRSGGASNAFRLAGGLGLIAAFAVVTFTKTPVLEAQSLKRVDYLNAGTLYAERGRLDEARAMLARAVAIDPGFGPAYQGLARLAHLEGRELEAVRLQATARRFAVGGQYGDTTAAPGEAMLFEAAERYRAGDHAGALVAFQSLRAAHRDAGRTGEALRMQNNVGLCQYKLGRLHEAEVTLRAILVEDSTYVYAYTNLARVLATTDRWEEAIALQERALALAPEDRRVATGLQRLRARLPDEEEGES